MFKGSFIVVDSLFIVALMVCGDSVFGPLFEVLYVLLVLALPCGAMG